MAGSTPIYGFPYPQSTDLVADYPTLGQELATDVETVISGLRPGLDIITPTSIANSGGSASASGGAVSFTSVTSISLNGVFTSTYQNYRIQLLISSISTPNIVNMRMRASGTDYAGGGYYYNGIWFSSSSANTYSTTRSSGAATQAYVMDLANPPGGATSAIELSNPQVADYARYTGAYSGFGNPDMYGGTQAGLIAVTTQFDGVSFIANTGNITGFIRVYGYKNS